MTTPEERIALHRAGEHDIDIDPHCPACPSRAVQYEDPPLPTYEVVFSANVHVALDTLDEDEARAVATHLAKELQEKYDMDEAQAEAAGDTGLPSVRVVIHTDDIVRVD